MAGRPLRRARLAHNPSFSEAVEIDVNRALADLGYNGHPDAKWLATYGAKLKDTVDRERWLAVVARFNSKWGMSRARMKEELGTPRKYTKEEIEAIARGRGESFAAVAKEYGYKPVKNPAGWMQEQSSAAVRRAIATRSPADIQRARDLQVRNEKARDSGKHKSRIPNPCVCGCGGNCGDYSTSEWVKTKAPATVISQFVNNVNSTYTLPAKTEVRFVKKSGAKKYAYEFVLRNGLVVRMDADDALDTMAKW